VRRNRQEEQACREISEELGLSLTEVRRAVCSFFGVILEEARKLPFNNHSRIYTKDKFDEFISVCNIPSIGRLGPVYSRYLTWRGNEAKMIEQEPRKKYRSRILQEDIEAMAEDILAGRTPAPVTKKRGNELYNRVWLVGQEGKTLARQVIPKKKKNVQD
jgi:hypothetical protein